MGFWVQEYRILGEYEKLYSKNFFSLTFYQPYLRWPKFYLSPIIINSIKILGFDNLIVKIISETCSLLVKRSCISVKFGS